MIRKEARGQTNASPGPLRNGQQAVPPRHLQGRAPQPLQLHLNAAQNHEGNPKHQVLKEHTPTDTRERDGYFLLQVRNPAHQHGLRPKYHQ